MTRMGEAVTLLIIDGYTLTFAGRGGTRHRETTHRAFGCPARGMAVDDRPYGLATQGKADLRRLRSLLSLERAPPAEGWACDTPDVPRTTTSSIRSTDRRTPG